MRRHNGFTLIELLIVVAIIAIIVAIVFANYQAAVVKARVARSQADINGLVNAVLQYRVEWNALPLVPGNESGESLLIAPSHFKDLYPLTTPVSYLSLGGTVSPWSVNHGYWFWNWTQLRQINQGPVKMFWNNLDNPQEVLWMAGTLGPYTLSFPYEPVSGGLVRGQTIMWFDYDVSNGIGSRGLIQRHGN